MLPDKPVSEITANDIVSEADWEELCQLEFDRQQAEYETALAAAKEACQAQIDREIADGNELASEQIAERINNVFVETQPETIEQIQAKFAFLKPQEIPVMEDTAPTVEQLFSQLRSMRDQKLSEYDKKVSQIERELREADEFVRPNLEHKLALWDAYADALCALPSQPGAPWDGGSSATPWPVKPE